MAAYLRTPARSPHGGDLAGTVTTVSGMSDDQMCQLCSVSVLWMLGRVRAAVGAACRRYTGTAPAHDVLDLRALGRRSRTSSDIRCPRTVGLRGITRRWLCDLWRTWTIRQRPDAGRFARILRGVELASRALAQRPGADGSARLRYDAVTSPPRWTRSVPHPGWMVSRPAGGHRMSFAGHFFALVDYGRRCGAADDLSAVFVRDPAAHRPPGGSRRGRHRRGGCRTR